MALPQLGARVSSIESRKQSVDKLGRTSGGEREGEGEFGDGRGKRRDGERALKLNRAEGLFRHCWREFLARKYSLRGGGEL
jgi:hypothetical protein